MYDALIFGCGYLGSRVARQWIRGGRKLCAVTRSPERIKLLRHLGIDAVVADVTDPNSLAGLPESREVLYAVGYASDQGISKRTVYVDGLRNVLATLPASTRLTYVSSTSVYGQSQGEWVDETTPTEPASDGGKICYDAEQLVRQSSCSWNILRLSGLYGPDRLLARIGSLRVGTPISGDPNAWLNLIHVSDAAEAVLRVTRSDASEETFLISDDEPVRRVDYYGHLARSVGGPTPTFDPSVSSRSPGLGKRCRNRKARQQLDWPLRYPTYREGLADALGQ